MTPKTDIIIFVSTQEEIRARWIKFANDFFVEWRGPTRKTISDLAREMELPRSTVSQSMGPDGKIPSELKTVIAWVKMAGPKVYEILEMPRPDSVDSIESLPEPMRSIVREVRETMAEYRVSANSPEGEAIVDEIMKKFGYK